MDEVTRGTFLRAKQQVTVAIDLLNWLTSHGTNLAGLTQTHLDLWQAEGPTTRLIAEHFLKWAIKAKAAPAAPRDSELSTSSPNSYPWPSSPKPSATPLQPSNATPPTQQPPTPNISRHGTHDGE